MKCCPATRRTARRCGRFWAGSKSNTARRGASARQRSTRAISGGNDQGATETVGEASDREALAEGEGGRRGQIAGPGRRALCLRPERRSRRQGTRDAAAAVEMAVDRLGKLAAMNVKREEMLMKLGAARSKAPTAWRLVEVALDKESAALTFSLNRQKLRIARRREGRYLLRTNLTDKDPAVLWQYYVQLVAVDIDQTWRLSRIKGWRVWGNARKQGAAEWQGCRAGGFEFGDCRRVRGDEFVEGPQHFDRAAA